jgi:hypothetical protein
MVLVLLVRKTVGLWSHSGRQEAIELWEAESLLGNGCKQIRFCRQHRTCTGKAWAWSPMHGEWSRYGTPDGFAGLHLEFQCMGRQPHWEGEMLQDADGMYYGPRGRRMVVIATYMWRLEMAASLCDAAAEWLLL